MVLQREADFLKVAIDVDGPHGAVGLRVPFPGHTYLLDSRFLAQLRNTNSIAHAGLLACSEAEETAGSL
jgi:hypothetical protein